MVGREDVDGLDLDYQLEDDVRNFALPDVGEHHIALRFSAQVKDPGQGFTFGRNPNRCDICLKKNDPNRRLSNVHFRIYLNEWAVLMLEDKSTNGTVVDETLLKLRANPPAETKRTLSSGSKIKILGPDPSHDLIFMVRIPLRDGQYHEAYQRNLDAYMANRAQPVVDVNETIVPGPGGHVRLPFSRHHANGYPRGCLTLTALSRWISSDLLPQDVLLPQRARPPTSPWLAGPKQTIHSRITAVLSQTGSKGRGTAPTNTIACARSAEALLPRCIK